MDLLGGRQTRDPSLRAVCQGDFSQGPPAEHPHLQQGSGSDPEAIQKRALVEGLPCQTLIASVLHKYAAGRLKER